MIVDGSVLLLFHCRTNTGYAIGALERTFHEMAVRLTGSAERVYYGYPSLSGGHPRHLPAEFSHVFQIDPATRDPRALAEVTARVRASQVRLVFAFDMSLAAPVLRALRTGGVDVIVSYWGASISSPYQWWLRPLRHIQYWLARHRPDHFIFESYGMRYGATHGAAIPLHRTSVCRLGVDTDRFAPVRDDSHYAYEQLGIPRTRKIIFFSGHMERRKGVHVLLAATKHLVNHHGRRDFHLLILGNQPGEERAFLDTVAGTQAEEHVTFGGYRNDVTSLHHSVYLGAIASTGWDSFTLSAAEMAASGIPLLVSDLPGLREAVEHGVTGFELPAGDHEAWAAAIAKLLDNPEERDRLAQASRERALREFGQALQVTTLTSIVQGVWEERRR